jgi:hypothetical protein
MYGRTSWHVVLRTVIESLVYLRIPAWAPCNPIPSMVSTYKDVDLYFIPLGFDAL